MKNSVNLFRSMSVLLAILSLLLFIHGLYGFDLSGFIPDINLFAQFFCGVALALLGLASGIKASRNSRTRDLIARTAVGLSILAIFLHLLKITFFSLLILGGPWV